MNPIRWNCDIFSQRAHCISQRLFAAGFYWLIVFQSLTGHDLDLLAGSCRVTCQPAYWIMTPIGQQSILKFKQAIERTIARIGPKSTSDEENSSTMCIPPCSKESLSLPQKLTVSVKFYASEEFWTFTNVTFFPTSKLRRTGMEKGKLRGGLLDGDRNW